MATESELREEIKSILSTKWKRRTGRTVPDVETITLGNDAVELDGTVLYADIVDSSKLVDGFKDWFAAEVYKSFLVASCRLIRSHEGDVTAFDGDRVMAVFLGDSKNSNAARCALRINHVVAKIINPAIKAEYPNTSYALRHAVGIDTSALFVAKTGIRKSNDLVWVGRAANLAAHLSSVREPGYSTFISSEVFDKLNEKSKYGGNPRKLMWEKSTATVPSRTIYRSSWTWAP